MQIAVDAMGGDHAPQSAVAGALRAASEGARIVLVGDRSRIEPEIERLSRGRGADAGGRVEIEHTAEYVAMDEKAVAVRHKRDASIRVCARLVREGRAQAVVTAGHTGAAMIAAKTVIGAIPGVDRPALAAIFPNRKGRTVVLDVGANVGARAAHLRQFAVMGHSYAQYIFATASPRVGLMSVGEEAGKGTKFTREAFAVLQDTGLNFVGNVEGRDVYSGAVDVIVCDGFVGNVMLKSSEALAGLLASRIREAMGRTWRSRLGYWLARDALGEIRQRTHWSETGAVPLLGVRGGFFIGHGRSTARAIKNAIRRAVEFCDADLHNKIHDKVAELHAQEAQILGQAG
jgi:glycerol-3-phosphate acyltransferase PlsX